MKLATLRLDGTTAAVRVDDDTATVIDGYLDLSALLVDPDWKELAGKASGQTVDLANADYAAVVPNPGKIVCVGLNYATHIKEMGRDLPEYPTLFAKFKEALAGPYDDIIVPDYASSALDWEAELAVVVGKQAYQVTQAEADAHIAGYSVINDYTMRDFQYRTLQWDQGKTFEKTSGFGPVLDTDYVLGTRIETRLDGELMQEASTDDLVFTPTRLIEYISHIVTLQPGDVIITGTTGGVGHARKPPRYIQHGQTVEVTIEGLGTVKNTTIIK
ncbi:fumarylacetoacetate hydrolase [Mycobacteroides abscessus subsp. bolletii]|uniref:fumarylacetoacetate hydrolase family protein n=1 Tax=Mycobacteroides abscessus TaxID=36809 RepID=UPI0009A7F606|nr:fumarylacetoacetate hydrolase family protein [Mycobacteroides abscessus]SKG69905.1 fumarylacetoacetate hydrolase [Mycobacteroides abscessus subsp. bolletii]SKH12315.1 fumarylacetoacetate hydrolase [Mycobacteroides abscessus subsp. bolletii]